MIILKIYLGIYLELLQAVWGQFSFRQFLAPAYTSSQGLQAPSNVVGAKHRVLILHLSLPKQFPLFILASVYWFPQCLISTLTQRGSGGHFFRLTCSVMLWGGRNTANKYHWHVWGVLAVFQSHWVCPHSQRVCFHDLHFSGSRLLESLLMKRRIRIYVNEESSVN